MLKKKKKQINDCTFNKKEKKNRNLGKNKSRIERKGEEIMKRHIWALLLIRSFNNKENRYSIWIWGHYCDVNSHSISQKSSVSLLSHKCLCVSVMFFLVFISVFCYCWFWVAKSQARGWCWCLGWGIAN